MLILNQHHIVVELIVTTNQKVLCPQVNNNTIFNDNFIANDCGAGVRLIADRLFDCFCAATTFAGVQLKSPATAAQCQTTNGQQQSNIGYNILWYFTTNLCSSSVYINSISVQATDSTTKFHVYTTENIDFSKNSFGAGSQYYGAGSSNKLTMEAVSCFNVAFRPGMTTALIPSSKRLLVIVRCESPQGCNFKWNIDSGCTVNVGVPTVSPVALDQCTSTCNPDGGTCQDYKCNCKPGFSGSNCQVVSSPVVPVDPVSQSCPVDQTCTQGQCWTNGGLKTTTACYCIQNDLTQKPMPGAADCDDCETKCKATTNNVGNACSSSSSYSSPTSTGVSCSDTRTLASSSTGSAADNTVTADWLGYYYAEGCDSSRCCCAQEISITASATDSAKYILLATNFNGTACGDNYRTPNYKVSTAIAKPTGNTIAHNLGYDGELHQATLLSSSQIQDVTRQMPACSSTFTKGPAKSQVYASATAVYPSGALFIVCFSLLLIGVALF